MVIAACEASSGPGANGDDPPDTTSDDSDGNVTSPYVDARSDATLGNDADPNDDAGTDADVESKILFHVAGGLGGAGSADGTGADARFTQPYGIAADGAGNL